MATSNMYGLINPVAKGKLSLQSLGQGVLEDDTQAPQQGNASPWSAAPLPQGSGDGSLVQRLALNPAQIAANFQWTGPYDAANRALQQQESDAGLSRTNSLSQIAARYLESNRQAQTDYERGRRKQFEGLADRGGLQSSAALDLLSEYDTDFNSYLDRLSKAKAYDEMGVENQYTSLLNQLGRQREGLASQQQAEEEARRVEEARIAAEAQRQAVEEENRRQQIQQLIAAQEQARLAAEAAQQAALAASYSYSAPGGGYDMGGGGDYYGGGGYAEPAPAPAPRPTQDMVVLPTFGNGVTTQAVDNWIKKNVDPYVSGTALAKVREVLSKAGPAGVSRADLGWLISQYPNAPKQTVTNRSASMITSRIK